MTGDVKLTWTPKPDKLEFGVLNYPKTQEFFCSYDWRPYDPAGSDGKVSHTMYELAGKWVDVGHRLKLIDYTAPVYPNTERNFRSRFPEDILVFNAEQAYYKNINDKYAYLQILYFVRRWFWEHSLYDWKHLHGFAEFWQNQFHGGKDVRQWGNWFVNLNICSEKVVMDFIVRVTREMVNIATDKKMRDDCAEDLEFLSGWNSNNFNSSDSRLFLERSNNWDEF